MNMRPPAIPYYHGTISLPAVQCLVGGGTLLPRRPEGRSVFSKAVEGLTYLTPCFKLAADYAMTTDRNDWPAEHDVEWADLSHVFEFDLSNVSSAVLEEDELGWAVMVAVTAGKRVSPCTMNILLMDALLGDVDTMRALAAEAERIIGKTARFHGLLDGRALTKTGQAAVGRRMANVMKPEMAERLMELGMSLGVQEPLAPVAAWTFDARMRMESSMDHPDKASVLAGPWCISGRHP